MESPNLQLVDYKQLNKLSFNLFSQINKFDTEKPDIIVAINRGGAVLARILSDLLQIKIGAFAISSYEVINQQKELVITQALNLQIKDKNILLVDEICDSGKTFLLALEHVNKLEPKSVKTCAMFVKPKTVFYPDFYVEKTAKWVVFPYEFRETLIALKDTDSAIKQKLNNYFVELGYSKEEIEYVLNY